MNARFRPGDRVKVRDIDVKTHVRTPRYVRGKTGEVVAALGAYRNPETLAYGADGLPRLELYRISFRQGALWPAYSGTPADTAIVEIFEPWLEPGKA